MRIVDPQTGKTLKRLDFDKKYFVEGSVILDGKLYILTWTNKLVFVYDAETFEYEKTLGYPREGWGLTTDGKQLIASDGSARLYFMDPSMKVKRTVTVRLNDRPIRYLNELEYIDGKIWANVYTSDIILIINPADGKVEATLDCTGLLPKQYADRRTDVLNGIAYNPADKKIYLTGKYWKRLFEIRLID
jgi:glutamine cyclotransferase